MMRRIFLVRRSNRSVNVDTNVDAARLGACATAIEYIILPCIE
jgi:hypothetical protein